MYPSPRSRSMSDSERLIKQTYSVHVSLPEDRAQCITRKWHISEFSVRLFDRMPELYLRSRIF
jgi:Gti1/Pac2 family transcription factor